MLYNIAISEGHIAKPKSRKMSEKIDMVTLEDETEAKLQKYHLNNLLIAENYQSKFKTQSPVKEKDVLVEKRSIVSMKFAQDCFAIVYKNETEASNSGFVVIDSSSLKEVIRFEPRFLKVKGLSSYEVQDLVIVSR